MIQHTSSPERANDGPNLPVVQEAEDYEADTRFSDPDRYATSLGRSKTKRTSSKSIAVRESVQSRLLFVPTKRADFCE